MEGVEGGRDVDAVGGVRLYRCCEDLIWLENRVKISFKRCDRLIGLASTLL